MRLPPPIDVPLEPAPSSIQVPSESAVTLPAPAPAPVVRTSPQLDLRRSPPTDNFYPAISRRLGEEGTVTVGACVGTDGRAVRTSVAQSSGYPRLDAAALEWAGRARWSPGTEDGRAVETCGYRFNVVFRLQ